MGDGVQGEPDLPGKIVQGDLEAEEWRELSLNSIMADFIHMDAAVVILCMCFIVEHGSLLYFSMLFCFSFN